MSQPTVLVHRTPDLLAASACARLITLLVDAQSAGQVPHWVLTGGTIADSIHATVAASPARDAVDWSRVELWWGDERFVPTGDPERNETRAREALLDHLRLDAARVHVVPPPANVGDDPDVAAEWYAQALGRAARLGGQGHVPAFDVLMLGVGPDGHVASLFPDRTDLVDARAVSAVRRSPKPPPVRITMTMPTLLRAKEVWFVAAGAAKAEAVSRALATGADPVHVPAARPRGTRRTLWLLDEAAAAELDPSDGRQRSRP